MKDVERAYLAGLFDGEGCASVIYSQYKKMTKKGERIYSGCGVTLVIANNDIRVLKEARFLCGKGGIYTRETSHTLRIYNASDVIETIENDLR